MALLTTAPSLRKATILTAIAALTLALEGLTDEGGKPFDPPLVPRAAYSDPLPTYPTLSVDYTPGGSEEGLGQNLIGIDDATGRASFGQYDNNGTLRLLFRCRKQAQRLWLHDWFDSALRAGALLDSDSGESVDGVLQLWLVTYGVQVNGFRAIEDPPPALDDPRPAGQRWDTTILLDVDVALVWEQVLSLSGANTITSITFTPAAVTPDGVTVPDLPFTVPAP